MKQPARSLLCGIATVSMLGIGLSVAIAGPAQAAPAAPTWDEVRAAKADASAAQQAVDELSARLSSLQDAADAASQAELEAGQVYAAAATKQQEAQATLDDLTSQSKRAKAKADDSAAQVAGLVVELSRTGGGDLSTSMLVDAKDASDLLYQVGTMSHLSERSATVLAQAQADQHAVDAIAAQQSAATTALAKATKTTKSTLDSANDAAASAQSRLQDEQSKQDEVLQQLAYLKGTSVATESAYWSAQRAQQAEAQLASQTTTGSTSGTTSTNTGSGTKSTGSGTESGGSGTKSSSSGTTPSTPGAPAKPSTPTTTPSKPTTTTPSTPVTTTPVTTTPAAPSPSKVAGALAYARAQIGKPYIFGGEGPAGYDCSGLVKMAYNSVGVATGAHNVVSQYYYFQSLGRLVPMSQRQPGDILFYSTNGSPSGGYHDSIYTGNGMMVEAANPQRGILERAIWTPSQLLPYVARPTGSV